MGPGGCTRDGRGRVIVTTAYRRQAPSAARSRDERPGRSAPLRAPPFFQSPESCLPMAAAAATVPGRAGQRAATAAAAPAASEGRGGRHCPARRRARLGGRLASVLAAGRSGSAAVEVWARSQLSAAARAAGEPPLQGTERSGGLCGCGWPLGFKGRNFLPHARMLSWRR